MPVWVSAEALFCFLIMQQLKDNMPSHEAIDH
jgi:hypothetical protein